MKISGVHVSRIWEFIQIVTYKSQIKEQSWDSLNWGFIWRAGNLSWQQINIEELCFVTRLTWQILEREVGGGKDCQSSCQEVQYQAQPGGQHGWEIRDVYLYFFSYPLKLFPHSLSLVIVWVSTLYSSMGIWARRG